MKRVLCIMFCGLFFATFFSYVAPMADAQYSEEWVARYNGPGNGHEETYDIALDSSGNIYITGMSSGNGTGSDFVTIKYSPAGEQLWVARYNGPKNHHDVAR
ncbi:MAG: SBBP repeat-containing protein, partial [Thermoplasmata archaeon]